MSVIRASAVASANEGVYRALVPVGTQHSMGLCQAFLPPLPPVPSPLPSPPPNPRKPATQAKLKSNTSHDVRRVRVEHVFDVCDVFEWSTCSTCATCSTYPTAYVICSLYSIPVFPYFVTLNDAKNSTLALNISKSTYHIYSIFLEMSYFSIMSFNCV